MGPTVVMEIPAVLRYDLTNDVAGEWLIERLRAYWELPAMMARFLRNGPPQRMALQLTRALMRNQGCAARRVSRRAFAVSGTAGSGQCGPSSKRCRPVTNWAHGVAWRRARPSRTASETR